MDTNIDWGPVCSCGRPTSAPHRHGTSEKAEHLIVLQRRRGGPRALVVAG